MAAQHEGQHGFRQVRLQRILLVTWIGYAAYSAGRRPMSVARAAITRDTGMTVAETGAIDTAFLIMYTAGQLAFGTIQRASGWSAASLLAAGLFGSSLTLLLLSVSSSMLMMALAWGLNGLLQAVGWASCMIVIAPWLATAERGLIMGVWGTTMAIGGVAGNVITPAAMQHTGGSWRAGVACVGCIMACVAVGVRLLLGHHPNAHGFVSPAQTAAGVASLEELRRGGAGCTKTADGELVPRDEDSETPSGNVSVAHESASKGKTAPGGMDPSSPRYLLLHVPGVAGLCAAYFFAKLVRYVLMFWLPFYFTNALNHGTGMAGVLASALDVGGIVGSVGSGVLSDRFHGGRRRAGFTVWLSAFFVLCLSGFSLGSSFAVNPAYAVAVGFACGACAYGIDSVITGSLVQDFAERQGVAAQLGAISGLIGGLGTLGSVLQGPFTVAFSGYSWDVLFGLLQLITLASMAALYRPWRLEVAAGASSGPQHPL